MSAIPYFAPRDADEAEVFAEYVRDARHAERFEPEDEWPSEEDALEQSPETGFFPHDA